MSDAPSTGTNDRDRHDVLIARVVDGNATSEDWRELRAIASHDQSIWAEIAEQQDLKRELDGAVEDAVSVAERVELPMHEHASVAPRRRLRLALTGGGWVAAAGLLLAFTVGVRGGVQTPALLSNGPSDGQRTVSAGIPSPITSAGEALAKYMELGRQSGEVIGELPTSLVLERTPTDDGRYKVVYLRQIVEQTFVDDVYQTATDDTGQTFVVPKASTPAALPTAN
ncbi:MAG: hypothetical protein AAFR96_02530 [Planctomycetota bacterium]